MGEHQQIARKSSPSHSDCQPFSADRALTVPSAFPLETHQPHGETGEGIEANAIRQWTCSELSSGHKELMAAKKEKETPEELQKKIQDLSLNHVLWYIGCAQVW